MSYLYQEITGIIINAAYELFNVLGAGFYEKVYERGLFFELQERGVMVENQVPCEVSYKGNILGEYYADIIVNDSVIVELKAEEEVTGHHKAQLINYLKATNYEVGLILCFGKKGVLHSRVVNYDLLRKTGKSHLIH